MLAEHACGQNKVLSKDGAQQLCSLEQSVMQIVINLRFLRFGISECVLDPTHIKFFKT